MSRMQPHYILDEELRKEIAAVKNKIMGYLADTKIYLFGSIAKGFRIITKEESLWNYFYGFLF
ncbi:MAG: hypothetical protein RSD02_12400 [Niameybacter sp.]